MSDRDHQWKFFEHLWKVEANKAEREFAFKSGWGACAKEYEKENDKTKGSCFHCEEVALMNVKLEEENARLREALTGLLYHCEDYGLKEESFAILMASNKARKALEKSE